MYVVTVFVHVLPACREDFLAATLENARNTRNEPGNLRFDVSVQQDDPNRFVLYEVYTDESGMAAHKETPHYAAWAETVAGMMAEPRRGIKHNSIDPLAPEAWRTGC